MGEVDVPKEPYYFKDMTTRQKIKWALLIVFIPLLFIFGVAGWQWLTGKLSEWTWG